VAAPTAVGVLNAAEVEMHTPFNPRLHEVPHSPPRLHVVVSEDNPEILGAWEAAMKSEGYDLDTTSEAARDFARSLARMDFLALVFSRAAS
jgi:hypothetical protein